MEGYAIELRNVTKTFGEVIANDNVNLTLKKGEILAILGENGSGKTTLMNMLSGIYFPDQGQILVNPLHLASIYTAFLNDGNMIKPYLHADGGSTSSEIWIKDAFSPQIVSEVMEGLEGVVNNPEGTGYGACREDIRLAGKTGTAELKATKEDTSGTEIGWFTVSTTDRDTKNPILLISMVENVKDIGGSGYVVEKDKAILDEYLGNE